MVFNIITTFENYKITFYYFFKRRNTFFRSTTSSFSAKNVQLLFTLYHARPLKSYDMVVQILKQIILVSIQNPLKFYTCIINFFAINMFYYITQGNRFHSFYKNNLKQVNTQIFQWRSVELDKGHEFIHTSPLYTRGKLTWAKIHFILREKIWFYF